MQQLTRFQLT